MSIYELLEDDENYYVVSEFIRGGELFDRIVKMKRFDEVKASYLIY
jgi:calcium-dependent protein kinase